jgi:hypothetical protein
MDIFVLLVSGTGYMDFLNLYVYYVDAIEAFKGCAVAFGGRLGIESRTLVESICNKGVL